MFVASRRSGQASCRPHWRAQSHIVGALRLCETLGMLTILIVEDDDLVATTLRSLVELNPLYVVTAVVADVQSALAAVAARPVDLALVDLHLGDERDGYALAAELVDLGIACLFVTGAPPDEDLPELALGCLMKPFSGEDLFRALQRAEDLMRGRQSLQRRSNTPENLVIYAEPGAETEQDEEERPASGTNGFIEDDGSGGGT